MALAILGASPLSSACYVDDLPPPAYADGYQPAFYDGYVVYYDEGGRPFYYRGGVQVWVPPGAPEYAGLVAHWHAYGPAYGHWYAHYGYRYHGYRGGFYYRR
jgi:hypothetical protein